VALDNLNQPNPTKRTKYDDLIHGPWAELEPCFVRNNQQNDAPQVSKRGLLVMCRFVGNHLSTSKSNILIAEKRWEA
jgi:hypothetical protein